MRCVRRVYRFTSPNSEAAKKGEQFNSVPWEIDWVENHQPLSAADAYSDPLEEAVKLVTQTLDEELPDLFNEKDENIGF